MRANKPWRLRLHCIIMVLAVCVPSGTAWPVMLAWDQTGGNFSVRAPIVGSLEPCPRGDIWDRCWVESYDQVPGASTVNSTTWPFPQAWAAFNAPLPAGQRWTLINGGALQGTITINRFRTFNDCPETGGVGIRAIYAPVGGDPADVRDPANVRWSQALCLNYVAGLRPDHPDPPAPWRFMMDGDPPGTTRGSPPLYDVNRPAFDDRPSAYCQHRRTVGFHATTLVSVADINNRTMTTYEGFTYGWNFFCVHEEPNPRCGRVFWGLRGSAEIAFDAETGKLSIDDYQINELYGNADYSNDPWMGSTVSISDMSLHAQQGTSGWEFANEGGTVTVTKGSDVLFSADMRLLLVDDAALAQNGANIWGFLTNIDVNTEVQSQFALDYLAQLSAHPEWAAELFGLSQLPLSSMTNDFTQSGNTVLDQMFGDQCPEPATICLLSLGGLLLVRRRTASADRPGR